MCRFTIQGLTPLVGLLFVLASGAAQAQFPPAPSAGTPSVSPPAGGTGLYTTQCGDAMSYFVYTSTDQGTQLVPDPSQTQPYGQALAGSSWNFWQMQSENGASTGRVTLSKGGQPLTASPALYTAQMSSDGNYQYFNVYYSSSKLVLYASVTYNLKSPKDSTAQVLYTSLDTSAGAYGTPITANVYYPMTFTPYAAPPTPSTPTPAPSGY